MLNPQISQAEDAAYWREATDILREISGNIPLPKTVYHYTTGDGLISIIKNQELRATQISCLNDATELAFSARLLIDKLQARMSASISPEDSLLLEEMHGMLSNISPEIDSAFVSCFSSKDDDLAQWRAYGNSDGAYAIGFDPQAIRDWAWQTRDLFLAVHYADGSNDALFERAIDSTIKFFSEGLVNRERDTWRTIFLQHWLPILSYIAPVIKHPKFDSENEWRLTYRFRAGDVAKIDCVQKRGMLSRFLSLPLRNNGNPFPISEIVVGPMRHQDISVVSVSDLLKAKGFSNVTVRPSEIPFRGA